MKVILVGPAFPLRGGIANFNEALCRALNKAGHETKIYSFSLQYPSFLFPGKTQYDTGKGPSDLDIVTCINSINPFSWFSTAALIKKEKPDLVILRFWLPVMAPCLGTLARLLRKHTKVIAITDNVIPHEKRPGDAMLTRYFVRYCQGFVTLSRSVLDDLSRFSDNPNKVFLPHPLYDIFGEAIGRAEARKHLKLPEEGNFILFFGFIRRYKGLDLLLEAMAEAGVKKNGVKLIVAGEYYEDAAYYEEIISRHQLGDSVLLHTHYIPSDEVKYYFCAADLVVQPYRSATQSGVTQIAYHFEKPMLVTHVGGLAEIVPDQKAGYVTATDPKAIGAAIADFFSNHRSEEFTAHVKTEKKRFYWPAFVEGVMGLYRKIRSESEELS
ncbi:MAG TPA: glycosyltransferase [Bacteroidia bacterium]|nr:glycosyltransferase [Bacteroidia bacterium]